MPGVLSLHNIGGLIPIGIHPSPSGSQLAVSVFCPGAAGQLILLRLQRSDDFCVSLASLELL